MRQNNQTVRRCTKENPCCLHFVEPNEDWDECCSFCEGKKGHIPKLAFKNGKAYCKICGENLE